MSMEVRSEVRYYEKQVEFAVSFHIPIGSVMALGDDGVKELIQKVLCASACAPDITADMARHAGDFQPKAPTVIRPWLIRT